MTLAKIKIVIQGFIVRKRIERLKRKVADMRGRTMERDKAVQTIRELIDTKVLGYDYNQALLVAFNELKECEATAEPYKNCYYAKVCRRPTGVWGGIDDETEILHEQWKCSNCGNTLDTYWQDELEEHKYCHKCGAKMSTPWADMGGKE